MLKDSLRLKGLSYRETDVASLVIRGLSNKQVANELFVTEKTIKFHLTNIYKKMHVKSRAQLIVWSMAHVSFEDKMDITKPQTTEQKMQDTTLNIPIGIAKVGNA